MNQHQRRSAERWWPVDILLESLRESRLWATRYALTPVRKQWFIRALTLPKVGRWLTGGTETSKQESSTLLRGIGRGIDADWLSALLAEMKRQRLVPAKRQSATLSSRKAPPRVDLTDFPAPPEGLLIPIRPGETLLVAARRGQADLKALQVFLRTYTLPQKRGPSSPFNLVARNVEWTWQYYVHNQRPTEIAAAWNEKHTDKSSATIALPSDITDSHVATAISRTASDLGLPYP